MPRIAVVDDDREVLEALEDVFVEAGFDVNVAPNGLRFVSALQVHPPDVIVLDVMMSWIDGFGLCRALKRNPEFRDIPVVFISGKTSAQDIQQGFDCGAVDYFPKPIDLGRLVDRMRELTAEQ